MSDLLKYKGTPEVFQFISKISNEFYLMNSETSPVMFVCTLSHVRLFVATWTIAHQAPLYMGFSGQEYWNG